MTADDCRWPLMLRTAGDGIESMLLRDSVIFQLLGASARADAPARRMSPVPRISEFSHVHRSTFGAARRGRGAYPEPHQRFNLPLPQIREAHRRQTWRPLVRQQ